MTADKEIVEPSPPIDYGEIKNKASETAVRVVNTVGNAVIGTAQGIGKAIGSVASKLFAKHESSGISGGTLPSDIVEDIKG